MYGYFKLTGIAMFVAGALLSAAMLFPRTARAQVQVTCADPNSCEFNCYPTTITDWNSFVVVDCSNSIQYGTGTNAKYVTHIAISDSAATNPTLVNRFISFATAAMLSGKSFVTWLPGYNQAATTQLFCDAANCRKASAVGITNGR